MTDLLTEPLPPQHPLERHAQLDTDTFCDHCGYNLHGQVVTRDERLGILVCRCPECGRYHPAGHATTAQSIWLSRIAAATLLLWIAVILGAILLILLGFGGIQFLHVDLFSYHKMVAPDGREVVYREMPATGGGPTSWKPVYADTSEPAPANTRHVRSLTPPRHERYFAPRWPDVFIVHFLSIALGIVTGILLVVVLWHWKKYRYRLVILMPLLPAAYVIIVGIYLEESYEFISIWAVQRILYHALIQSAGIAIGIQIGRPIARAFARTFIPPRPRQHLAFLWKIDGKTPPPATA